jgi:hypothetical protein
MKALGTLIFAIFFGMLLYHVHQVTLEERERKTAARERERCNQRMDAQADTHAAEVDALQQVIVSKDAELRAALKDIAELKQLFAQAQAELYSARQAQTLGDSIQAAQALSIALLQDSVREMKLWYLLLEAQQAPQPAGSIQANHLLQNKLPAKQPSIRLPKLHLSNRLAMALCIAGIVVALTVLAAALQGLLYRHRRF